MNWHARFTGVWTTASGYFGNLKCSNLDRDLLSWDERNICLHSPYIKAECRQIFHTWSIWVILAHKSFSTKIVCSPSLLIVHHWLGRNNHGEEPSQLTKDNQMTTTHWQESMYITQSWHIYIYVLYKIHYNTLFSIHPPSLNQPYSILFMSRFFLSVLAGIQLLSSSTRWCMVFTREISPKKNLVEKLTTHPIGISQIRDSQKRHFGGSLEKIGHLMDCLQQQVIHPDPKSTPRKDVPKKLTTL